jgi:hypothetical protein
MILKVFPLSMIGSEMVCHTGAKVSQMEETAQFQAEDNNDLQVFTLPVTQRRPGSLFKIVFPSSSDFYGRITIYRLEVFGTKHSDGSESAVIEMN